MIPPPRLTTLSIRSLLLLITLVVALPAAGLILYSGIQFRNAMFNEAKNDTAKLADRIATDQQNLVAGAEQLMAALSLLPEVRGRDAARVEPVLRELRKLNPMFSNIFIADPKGTVWATAVPVKPPFFIGDRRYFRNALASGRLSSGEYVVSRATARPALNLAYPLRNDHGAIIGVISVGFVIDRYRQLPEQMKLPAGSSFVLLDHRGVVLSRAINPESFIGKPYPEDEFRNMERGPESGTTLRTSIGGDKRIISYRKIRLSGEQNPYLYVGAGIPVSMAAREANKALTKTVALFTSFLVLACFAAALIGKRSIVDRFKLLEDASQRLAAGDLQVRVSELVAGGELGSLGKTFDAMAEQLAAREAERLKAEAEKDLLTGQLIQAHKMESIGRLAGGVAHDFNNLLTPIIGYSELLKKDLKGDESALGRVGNILSAANRSKEIVQQLLSFSRKQVMEMKIVDLNQVIKAFRGILRHTIRESIDIRLDLAEEGHCIRADGNQIEQVIMNLAVNAQDAIGARGSITIGTSPVRIDDEDARRHPEVPPGRYLVLAITDDGCGMAPETLLRIFEPFFTSKGVGKGTGLGLATVYGIVRQHGGNIRVESEPGKGTAFRCYFPLVDELPASEQPAMHRPDSPAGGRRTILLVEDNEMVRTLVSELLKRQGFDLLVADDPKQALQISENRSLDLLVTDVVMPGMTGQELHARLLDRYRGLKVLFMSGYSDNVIARQGGLDDGMQFIQKPFSIDEFARRVETSLAE